MKKSLNIALLGTRGIPNTYGGFEQCAEYLSQGLVGKGHQVSVYCSSNHGQQLPNWNGVDLIHCNDPEDKYGSAGQFIYDLNCILDARHRNYDVIIQFGYTSSSIWHWLWPKQSTHIVNMDGMEFLRAKYGPITKLFLKGAEKLAALGADILVADNIGIQSYLEDKFPQNQTRFISYGADFSKKIKLNLSILQVFNLKSNEFDLIICRMVPENSVLTMLKAHELSNHNRKLVVVGDTNNSFGKRLLSKFNGPRIVFTQGVYDISALNTLRSNCLYYLHGHTVGGTNPSLLEAMAYSHRIIAHNNGFNRSILGEYSTYFSDELSLSKISNRVDINSQLEFTQSILANNHRWRDIIDQYESACYEVV